MSNRQLDKWMGRDDGQKVANYLGLTYEEYVALEPSVDEQVGDDGLVYCYLLTFEQAVPAVVAVKIKDLQDNQVALPPGFFDAAEPEWPQG